jgi:hypothetical protein
MPLFEQLPNDADLAYRNIFRGEYPAERTIRDGLERLWQVYEPYADIDFRLRFARQPDPHFWEMYLAVQLLEAGKNVRPRSDLRATDRDTGPDIRIVEEGRTVWIEAVTPEVGDPENPDRVPSLTPLNEGGQAQYAPRRQVELRITSALLQKRDAFERYRQARIVTHDDLCIAAISGARFWAQSATMGWPQAITAVYPVGDHYFTFDRATTEITDSGFMVSEAIPRAEADPIPRAAFLDDHFSGLSGLIWSRVTIGNFSHKSQDFGFVHNHAAKPELRLPRRWFPWAEEYVVEEIGDNIEVTRASPGDETE